MKQTWKIKKGVCAGYVMLYSEHFHFCSDEAKNTLFTCYCSNVYLCSLWVKFRKSYMYHLIVSYNNAFRILHGLPMRCSASGMFARSGVNSFQTCIRRNVYSFKYRLHASLNSIVSVSVSASYCIPQCVRLIAGVCTHYVVKRRTQ